MVDLKFLHSPLGGRPLLAVLYEDTRKARHIKTYEVALREKVGDAVPCMNHCSAFAVRRSVVEMQLNKVGPCRFAVLLRERCISATLSLQLQELHEGPWSQRDLDGGANIIIPIPAPLGGAVVVGENVVAYFNEGGPPKVTPIQPTIVQVCQKHDSAHRDHIAAVYTTKAYDDI